ncbi:type IIL restriction-modification enzyme MmeI [Auritidibacter ignavus]|uniref:type IIL restriction-modification enzyme MmeI n=1 Tax=Auritidibacter ignavus TaxID=678932 RepID=UPI002A4E224E|nr:type IIL restriction-modification enzyme MmeI [Auritidibacter ignavus]
MAVSWRDRINQWRAEGTESGTEKRYAQQFWSDLMKCFGITPECMDVFERNADRASTGHRGYIDFFWSGVVIGEAKAR